MNPTKSMKKLHIISIVIILILLAIIVVLLTNNITNKVVISSEDSFKENISSSNALTMMYETDYQSGEYQVSSDSLWPQDGYTFNETLSKCENGGRLTWDDENKRVLLQTNTSDKCFVYFDKEPNTLASYITSLYTSDGANGLYLHDGSGTYGSLEAGDDSYRYSGANPNNYVCFGSDAATCPTDNLYRIIGVFDGQVKLMKSTSYGNYAWDSGNSNTWNASTKPDIYTTLNTTYLNSIGEWASKIASHTWEVGGMARDTSATAKEYYQTEVGASQSGYVETMKIGLMYVSDYGYAAAPSNWTTELHNYESATSTNWAYLGYYEWTISRWSDVSSYAFYVDYAGYVGNDLYDVTDEGVFWVRPSFYLNSDVQYISGTGTESDPFRIA